MVEDIIIIGSGPAGLTAALYTAREAFNPLVISGMAAGGQLLLTNEVENYPGFPDGVLGPELMDMMRKQAGRFRARFVDGDATAVDFKSRPYKVSVGSQTFEANCVIVATGASANWLGIESERKFIGKGVSSCATCDAPFFKDKNVIVVGGGDTAMEDSIFLTKFASSVTIVHRRDQFRASNIMQERAKSNPKIKFIWNSIVEEIKGAAKVSAVKLRNLVTNEVTEMSIDGVFVAIGYSPNTAIFKDQLELDGKGYIVTRDEVETGLEGVYVAGDVADFKYRQAVTASGSGAKAALHAREYILKMRYEQSKGKPQA